MRRLPPLSAIRVFEAAARHGNFTRAADELGMTQAAVSYQVKLLEERVGAPLFRRNGRRVALTDAGVRLAPELSRALDMMDAAFADVRAEDEALLVISTANTFANAWLAWRLGSFQLSHPEMAVRVDTSERLVDLAGGEADCAIRLGAGDWPGVMSEKLIQIDYTPMMSPAFMERYRPSTPADLLGIPLISPHEPYWGQWFEQTGVEVSRRPHRPGVLLDSQASEGHAAIASQGVAMLTPFFWRNDLAAEKLVRPFEQVTPTDKAYWFSVAEPRRNLAKIKRFREWLIAEIERDLRGEDATAPLLLALGPGGC